MAKATAKKESAISNPPKAEGKEESQAKRKASVSETKSRKESSRAKRGGFYFVCPNHGRIPRDEVIFLCNTCGPQEMTEKNGVHMCPKCLIPGDNFQCFLCGSTKVEMREAGE